MIAPVIPVRQTQENTAQQSGKESPRSILGPDSTIFTLGLAAVLVVAVWQVIAFISPHPNTSDRSIIAARAGAASSAGTGERATALAITVATAPGRVKPKGGEVHIRPEILGLIRKVLVTTSDNIIEGDIIALLDEEQARARLHAARAEVRIRLAERAEEPASTPAMSTWRQALDNAAMAERRLHLARNALDQLLIARYSGNQISDLSLERARYEIRVALTDLNAKRQALANIENKPVQPISTRLDSGLAIARSDLRLAEIAYEKTRIRATSSGTVLQLSLKAGELANPAGKAPVAIIGNLSKLEVTAEVDERYINQIKKGQPVVIRSDAFEDQEYSATVTRLAPRVNVPGLGLRGLNEARDVEVLEVDITLDDTPPLLPGMRVVVYFKSAKPSP